MSARSRRRFERHFIACEECWREVELGRRGRALAESSRELAPQHLRELVRSTVAASSPPRRRFPFAALGAVTVAVVALAAVLALSQSGQPRAIEVILADFHGNERLDRQGEVALPAELGDMRLTEVRRGSVDEMPLLVHEYADPAGHKVLIYQSSVSFPVADGAEHAPSDATWSARSDGVVMFCSDRPIPSLVVGDDARQVRLASEELGLK